MNDTPQITIRPPVQDDFDQWLPLYQGYADFYKVPAEERNPHATWGWLMDPQHEVEGLLAFLGESETPCGFAHVRRMPSPLRGIYIGFLDDLFVTPESRGNRVGEALFDALGDLAMERGWPRIRWITADDNYRARALYDQLSKKTLWNLYEMDTPAAG